MNQIFSKLGLAVTFSPTGKALLKETKRLKELFSTELVLIHVGEKKPEQQEQLNQIVLQAGYDLDKIEIIWSTGEPANVILEKSANAGVDLLIAGALEKESMLKYYVGSVARKIMRRASSSVLILKSPSENPKSFKRFYVSTDFSIQSERTVRLAYNFALRDECEEFVILRDFYIPGLATTVLDSGSIDETEFIRNKWQEEEEEKMRIFVKELNLKPLPIKTKCLYGKEGWETSNYARENKADIFIVSVPAKKFKFIDRLFPHEDEYSFESLPSNLLIVR